MGISNAKNKDLVDSKKVICSAYKINCSVFLGIVGHIPHKV